jgi:Domain of unknown function (DUF4411)
MPIRPAKYLVDSNIFMEAARRYYPLDFAKPFWDAMIKFAKQGKIISIDKVFDELKQGNDLLKEWAVNDFKNYFDDTQTEDVLKNYIELVQHAQAQTQYNQAAKDRFMEDDNADTWILAYARTNNCVIVTHEVADSNIKRNIPIPNICKDFDIKYCDTFEMLRALDFNF